MSEAIVIVPAAVVPDLRRMVHKDFLWWAEQLANARGNDAETFSERMEGVA